MASSGAASAAGSGSASASSEGAASSAAGVASLSSADASTGSASATASSCGDGVSSASVTSSASTGGSWGASSVSAVVSSSASSVAGSAGGGAGGPEGGPLGGPLGGPEGGPLGGPEGELYRDFWPHAHHIIGKDILRFHAVYWPCFLMSAGLPLPRKIIAHGWWTVEGEKMSKSKGNAIDPNKAVAAVGADAFRYFLLREISFGSDGDFSQAALLTRVNSDLGNDYGNLLNRSLGMIKKYRGSTLNATARPGDAGWGELEAKLLEIVSASREGLINAMSEKSGEDLQQYLNN